MNIKKISLFLYSFLFINSCFSLGNLKISEKKIKILVLVIASDNLPVYIELQKLWRSYMHYNPEQVEAYFIKADTDLSNICEIKEDIIWSRCEESLTPGIVNKTVLSLDLLLPRIKTEFDYILRTNLSSFWIFPKLLDFLETTPRANFFSGYILGNIISGAGMIMSSDVAEIIVKNKDQLLNNSIHNDDGVISYILRDNGIGKTDYSRFDILSIEDWDKLSSLPTNFSHFRLKNNDNKLRLKDEIYIYRQLIDKFY